MPDISYPLYPFISICLQWPYVIMTVSHHLPKSSPVDSAPANLTAPDSQDSIMPACILADSVILSTLKIWGQEDIKMVILRNSRHSRIIPLLTIVVFLCQFTCGKVIYVGNDDQADFDKIQTGIEAADFNDTVSVAPGTYYENIILKDGIVLSGAGADVTIIDANGYGDVVDARANDAVISGFTLRNSGQFDLEHTNCGVYVDGSYAPTIKNNVIAHNRNGIGLWYGANPYISNNIIKNNNNGFYIYGSEENPSNPSIINNTIVNNQISGIILRVMVSPVITNNIIVGHTTGVNHNYVIGSPTIRYNNLWHNDVNYLRDNSADDTLAGPGSMSVDPYFARSGRWVDVNDLSLTVEPDDPNAVRIDDDYHLKSQTGRWDPNSQTWVPDEVTSPCIDVGDPNSPIGNEPFPNGGRINMGAFGGTAEASKSLCRKSIYIFWPEQSMVIQTGGIAGVNGAYILTGQFQLTIDFGAGKARFSNVEARATDYSEPVHKLDPNDVFNLTGLTGTIRKDGSIQFTGRTADESNVLLYITLSDEWMSLKGQTTPPPNSADFFIFDLDAVACRKYGGGTGERNNPFLIYTAEHLNALGAEPNDWDKHFKLMADIELDPNLTDGHVYTHAVIAPDMDTARDFQGTPFTGSFDGDYHKILHLTIQGGSSHFLGLFGTVTESGAIRRLIMENTFIRGSDYIGTLVGHNNGTIETCSISCNLSSEPYGDYIGGLAGINDGVLKDCDVTGSVISLGSAGYIGGVVGINTGMLMRCFASVNISGRANVHDLAGLVGYNWGRIDSCCATGDISGADQSKFLGGLVGSTNGGIISYSFATGTVSGGLSSDRLGGLVGGNPKGSIMNCYATGNVSGQDNSWSLGGLVGDSLDTITNCWANGFISIGNNERRVGGLVGYNWQDSAITSSFWDVEASGQQSSNGGIGKTTAEMQTAATFLDAGWDFVGETENGTEDIWWIIEGQDYPRLWWEDNGN